MLCNNGSPITGCLIASVVHTVLISVSLLHNIRHIEYTILQQYRKSNPYEKVQLEKDCGYVVFKARNAPPVCAELFANTVPSTYTDRPYSGYYESSHTMTEKDHYLIIIVQLRSWLLLFLSFSLSILALLLLLILLLLLSSLLLDFHIIMYHYCTVIIIILLLSLSFIECYHCHYSSCSNLLSNTFNCTRPMTKIAPPHADADSPKLFLRICMYVCMYVCMSCMYVCMYVYMYTCMYVCMYMYVVCMYGM